MKPTKAGPIYYFKTDIRLVLCRFTISSHNRFYSWKLSNKPIDKWLMILHSFISIIPQLFLPYKLITVKPSSINCNSWFICHMFIRLKRRISQSWRSWILRLLTVKRTANVCFRRNESWNAITCYGMHWRFAFHTFILGHINFPGY